MMEVGVLQRLTDFAEGDDNIRAVLLEGSRALGKADSFSDYDVVLVTRSNGPCLDGAILPLMTEWFGEIAVMQTPDSGCPQDVLTHMIQFTGGTRIDLTFKSLEYLTRTSCESATVTVLDKDGRFLFLPPPSESDFWVRRPTAGQFRECCNEFWWVSPYVAKALARRGALHALGLLNENVRPEYVRMLSWIAGAETGFAASVGKHASDIGRFVPEAWHEALLKSYPRAGCDEIRNSLDCLMHAFPQLAKEVSGRFGFVYDSAEGERTVMSIEKYLT
jgi:aminoglycoside 6-adenylyltransferase